MIKIYGRWYGTSVEDALAAAALRLTLGDDTVTLHATAEQVDELRQAVAEHDAEPRRPADRKGRMFVEREG